MFPIIKRKINTLRRITENPDELRLFILSRFPWMSPTSYWLRWFYPAWWNYLLYRLASFGRKKREFKKDPLSRFLLRIPNVAGIGDQIVTSWSETYMLAREYDLTFVHHPFVKSPHDQILDWDDFLGFGSDEVQKKEVMQNDAIKVVWLPPISLANRNNINLMSRIVNQAYPQKNVLFRLPSKIYFGVDIDQKEIMPAIYSKKYESARRKNPVDLGFDRGFLHVGVHIRRDDLKSLKKTNVQQWKWRWVSDTYYLNALTDLVPLLKQPFKIHIFSNGTEGELFTFSQIPHSILHVNEDPRRTFHGMVVADILISSSSAFAICAGKISRGLKLVGRGFDHAQFRLFVPDTSDWLTIEPTGHLSGQTIKAMKEWLDYREIMKRETESV